MLLRLSATPSMANVSSTIRLGITQYGLFDTLCLHDLVLCQPSMGVCFHALAARLIQILDEAQVERAATVLVALEFSYRSLGSVCGIETNDTRAPGSTTRLILYFGLLNLANRSE